jgi:hypothetical protein
MKVRYGLYCATLLFAFVLHANETLLAQDVAAAARANRASHSDTASGKANRESYSPRRGGSANLWWRPFPGWLGNL